MYKWPSGALIMSHAELAGCVSNPWHANVNWPLLLEYRDAFNAEL